MTLFHQSARHSILPLVTLGFIGIAVFINAININTPTSTTPSANVSDIYQTHFDFQGDSLNWYPVGMNIMALQNPYQFVAQIQSTSYDLASLTSPKLEVSLRQGYPIVKILVGLQPLHNGVLVNTSNQNQPQTNLRLSYLTDQDNQWSEDKSVIVPISLDSKLHELEFDLGNSIYAKRMPELSNQVITYIKLQLIVPTHSSFSMLEMKIDTISINPNY